MHRIAMFTGCWSVRYAASPPAENIDASRIARCLVDASDIPVLTPGFDLYTIRCFFSSFLLPEIMQRARQRSSRTTSKTRRQDTVSCHPRRLVCPFHARQPHNGKRSGSCHGTGFDTPARVVEHIKKIHSPLTRPNPLGASTGTISSYATLETGCPMSSGGVDEHVTGEQLDQINDIPAKQYDRSEKWGKIYCIIFPDDVEIPSPYVDPMEHLSQYVKDGSRWLMSGLPEALSLTHEETLSFLNQMDIFCRFVRQMDNSPFRRTKSQQDMTNSVDAVLIAPAYWDYGDATANNCPPDPPGTESMAASSIDTSTMPLICIEEGSVASDQTVDQADMDTGTPSAFIDEFLIFE
ncbi:hypothetical protein BJ170DRAFT_133449 [Xylariales sp. AK1849]|nr:hypothetical protein BJ170DRAFT_133449 [Xylariales sp. AK1849]